MVWHVIVGALKVSGSLISSSPLAAQLSKDKMNRTFFHFKKSLFTIELKAVISHISYEILRKTVNAHLFLASVA